MEQIEVSIRLSMSGVSYQPNTDSGHGSPSSSSSSSSPTMVPPPPAVGPAVAQPKVIPQQPAFYHATSNTPTDVMELSSTCVY